MGVVMGVDSNFIQFITILSGINEAKKNPGALIYKASGKSG